MTSLLRADGYGVVNATALNPGHGIVIFDRMEVQPGSLGNPK